MKEEAVKEEVEKELSDTDLEQVVGGKALDNRRVQVVNVRNAGSRVVAVRGRRRR